MRTAIGRFIARLFAPPQEARALLADRFLQSLSPVDDGRIHELWVTEAQRRLEEEAQGAGLQTPSDAHPQPSAPDPPPTPGTPSKPLR